MGCSLHGLSMIANKVAPLTCDVQGSYSFEFFKFHDFPWLFPWTHPVFHDLKFLAVTFENFQNYSCFGGILTQFNRHKNWCPPKFVSCIHTDNITCVYLTLSLLLTSAVTNLLSVTWIFHDFKDWQLNSMTFQAWKVKFLNILKFHGFPGFPWPVWTLMYALF